MPDLLFCFFALFTVIAAAGVVCNRNAVNAAMCLLLCLAGVAGLFVALDAFLLAFLMILVYAGAVVALFLFIIMLLDIQGQAPAGRRGLATFAGLGAVALLLVGWVALAVRDRGDIPGTPAAPHFNATLQIYADLLFTTYLLPVEIIGFLLLIAMLGVIALSQRAPAAKPRPAVSE